jgi:hypothetical protein
METSHVASRSEVLERNATGLLDGIEHLSRSPIGNLDPIHEFIEQRGLHWGNLRESDSHTVTIAAEQSGEVPLETALFRCMQKSRPVANHAAAVALAAVQLPSPPPEDASITRLPELAHKPRRTIGRGRVLREHFIVCMVLIGISDTIASTIVSAACSLATWTTMDTKASQARVLLRKQWVTTRANSAIRTFCQLTVLIYHFVVQRDWPLLKCIVLTGLSSNTFLQHRCLRCQMQHLFSSMIPNLRYGFQLLLLVAFKSWLFRGPTSLMLTFAYSLLWLTQLTWANSHVSDQILAARQIRLLTFPGIHSLGFPIRFLLPALIDIDS